MTKIIIKNSNAKMKYHEKEIFIVNSSDYFPNIDMASITLESTTGNWRLISHTDKNTTQRWEMLIEVNYEQIIFKRPTFKQWIRKPYKLWLIIVNQETVWVTEDDFVIKQTYTREEKNDG